MADCPEDAAVPGTDPPDRVYEAEAITVEWRATRCIHAAHCLRTAPAVFDAAARPWIDLDGADPDVVAEAVRSCPTGALRYRAESLPPDDGSDTPVEISAQPGGPLYIRGQVRITDHEDVELTTEPRIALCRCGRSQNKPYCDNSHRSGTGGSEPS
jgi:uncharacterized Fe-S cluster protein YjdI